MIRVDNWEVDILVEKKDNCMSESLRSTNTKTIQYGPVAQVSTIQYDPVAQVSTIRYGLVAQVLTIWCSLVAQVLGISKWQNWDLIQCGACGRSYGEMCSSWRQGQGLGMSAGSAIVMATCDTSTAWYIDRTQSRVRHVDRTATLV